MYSYFSIYDPAGVKQIGECHCGKCTAYPELFHATRFTNRYITDRKEADRYLLTYPDAVIIEHYTDRYNGFASHSYKNHKTGVTWQYNGKRWKPLVTSLIKK